MSVQSRFDKIAALRIRYIRLILAGVKGGDVWFNGPLAEIKSQWPELVALEEERGHD